MATGKSILIGWAAIAIFALSAFAQETGSFRREDVNSRSSTQGATQSRKVMVWRGDLPPAAPSPRPMARNDQQTGLVVSEERSIEETQPAVGQTNASGLTMGSSSYLGDSQDDHQACDCNCESCCTPFWEHQTSFFAEYLYLRPTGINMVHAIQSTDTGASGGTGFTPGFTPGAAPDGGVGVLNPVYVPAYRVGFNKALDSCSSVGASWAKFQNHSENTLLAPTTPGQENNLNATSLVLHPNVPNISPNAQLIDAGYDIDFQLIDIDYRRLLSGGYRHALNYSVGVRYGNLRQQFQQVADFAQTLGTTQTNTDIKFNGVGLRTGLDGLHQIGNSRLSCYGKGFISVLFGEFNSSYTQVNTTTTDVLAVSNWADVRPVPILEYELGLNWISQSGCWRISNGYYTAFWFNAITTPQYVQAIQTSNFVHLGETVSFNGLVTRLEYRF
ncbi:MAG: hypothetical protein HY288_08050 [Planctomycetia bacterium]|nr:hypothetical protein [Planctomycetia bacterium]